MDTIRKMLLIFLGDTLVMLISWAGLSLILFGIREFTGPEAGLVKILSIHSYVVVMFCYAFYLIFDLGEYLSTQSRRREIEAQKSEESTRQNLESKLLLRLVFTRTVKVMAICLTLTSIVWLLWLGKYTLGSFLAGAAFGFLVLWVMSFLKHRPVCRENKEGLSAAGNMGKLAGSEQVISQAKVED
jgi:Na+/glutamate symporter